MPATHQRDKSYLCSRRRCGWLSTLWIHGVHFRRRLVVLACFFFQAEDGIRDRNVTGVQTCALPISISSRSVLADAARAATRPAGSVSFRWTNSPPCSARAIAKLASGSRSHSQALRSEERRVGKEHRLAGEPLDSLKRRQRGVCPCVD